MIPLQDNPSREADASDFAANTPEGASRRRRDHHENIAIDCKVDVNGERVKPLRFGRSARDDEPEDGAEAEGQFGHGFGHLFFGRGSIKEDDDGAGRVDGGEKKAGLGDEAAVSEEKNPAERCVEGDVYIRLQDRVY